MKKQCASGSPFCLFVCFFPFLVVSLVTTEDDEIYFCLGGGEKLQEIRLLTLEQILLSA